jgi:hypothetical protein
MSSRRSVQEPASLVVSPRLGLGARNGGDRVTERVMSGAKLRTENAVNSVMADQTVEAELAQLVSEYLQHHRCSRAYEVRLRTACRSYPNARARARLAPSNGEHRSQ